MDAHVTSLWNSFRQVPPAAVPAVLDCVLASTGLSSSLLFSSFLDAFPNLTEEMGKFVSEEPNYIRSVVAALCHLLKKS
ncbi:tRNA (guanosine(18)-2'-O)-methyltransferase, partial [Sarracenia purpurea var. burkii]